MADPIKLELDAKDLEGGLRALNTIIERFEKAIETSVASVKELQASFDRFATSAKAGKGVKAAVEGQEKIQKKVKETAKVLEKQTRDQVRGLAALTRKERELNSEMERRARTARKQVQATAGGTTTRRTSAEVKEDRERTARARRLSSLATQINQERLGGGRLDGVSGPVVTQIRKLALHLGSLDKAIERTAAEINKDRASIQGGKLQKTRTDLGLGTQVLGLQGRGGALEGVRAPVITRLKKLAAEIGSLDRAMELLSVEINKDKEAFARLDSQKKLDQAQEQLAKQIDRRRRALQAEARLDKELGEDQRLKGQARTLARDRILSGQTPASVLADPLIASSIVAAGAGGGGGGGGRSGGGSGGGGGGRGTGRRDSGRGTRQIEALTRLDRSLVNTSERVSGLINSIRFLFGTVLAGYAVRQAVTFAGEFEQSISQIETLLNNSSVTISRYRQQLVELSLVSSKDLLDVTKTLYQTISGGIPQVEGAAGAFAVTEAAVRAAEAGLSSSEEAANGLISVMNAYKDTNLTAAEASDKLLLTVFRGRTLFPDLAGSIGRVASTAATFGVTLDELLAGLAALTRVGLSTENAVVALNRVILGLASPSAEAAKAFEAIGFEATAAALQQRGLAGSIRELNRVAGGNADVMKLLFKNVRAQRGIIPLTANAYEDFESILSDLGNAAGATDEALEKVEDNLNRQALLLKSRFQAVLIGAVGDTKRLTDFLKLLGDALVANEPAIRRFAQAMLNGLIAAGEWLIRNGRTILSFGADLVQVLVASKVASSVVAFGQGLSKLAGNLTKVGGAGALALKPLAALAALGSGGLGKILALAGAVGVLGANLGQKLAEGMQEGFAARGGLIGAITGGLALGTFGTVIGLKIGAAIGGPIGAAFGAVLGGASAVVGAGIGGAGGLALGAQESDREIRDELERRIKVGQLLDKDIQKLAKDKGVRTPEQERDFADAQINQVLSGGGLFTEQFFDRERAKALQERGGLLLPSGLAEDVSGGGVLRAAEVARQRIADLESAPVKGREGVEKRIRLLERLKADLAALEKAAAGVEASIGDSLVSGFARDQDGRLVLDEEGVATIRFAADVELVKGDVKTAADIFKDVFDQEVQARKDALGVLPLDIDDEALIDRAQAAVEDAFRLSRDRTDQLIAREQQKVIGTRADAGRRVESLQKALSSGIGVNIDFLYSAERGRLAELPDVADKFDISRQQAALLSTLRDQGESAIAPILEKGVFSTGIGSEEFSFNQTDLLGLTKKIRDALSEGGALERSEDAASISNFVDSVAQTVGLQKRLAQLEKSRREKFSEEEIARQEFNARIQTQIALTQARAADAVSGVKRNKELRDEEFGREKELSALRVSGAEQEIEELTQGYDILQQKSKRILDQDVEGLQRVLGLRKDEAELLDEQLSVIRERRDIALAEADNRRQAAKDEAQAKSLEDQGAKSATVTELRSKFGQGDFSVFGDPVEVQEFIELLDRLGGYGNDPIFDNILTPDVDEYAEGLAAAVGQADALAASLAKAEKEQDKVNVGAGEGSRLFKEAAEQLLTLQQGRVGFLKSIMNALEDQFRIAEEQEEQARRRAELDSEKAAGERTTIRRIWAVGNLEREILKLQAEQAEQSGALAEAAKKRADELERALGLERGLLDLELERFRFRSGLIQREGERIGVPDRDLTFIEASRRRRELAIEERRIQAEFDAEDARRQGEVDELQRQIDRRRDQIADRGGDATGAIEDQIALLQIRIQRIQALAGDNSPIARNQRNNTFATLALREKIIRDRIRLAGGDEGDKVLGDLEDKLDKAVERAEERQLRLSVLEFEFEKARDRMITDLEDSLSRLKVQPKLELSPEGDLARVLGFGGFAERERGRLLGLDTTARRVEDAVPVLARSAREFREREVERIALERLRATGATPEDSPEEFLRFQAAAAQEFGSREVLASLLETKLLAGEQGVDGLGFSPGELATLSRLGGASPGTFDEDAIRRLIRELREGDEGRLVDTTDLAAGAIRNAGALLGGEVTSASLSSVGVSAPPWVVAAVEAIRGLPDALQSASEFLRTGLVDFFESLFASLDEFILALLEGLPEQLITLLSESLPALIEGLADRADEIVEALILAVPRIVEAFVRFMIVGVPRIVWALVTTLPGALVRGVVEAFSRINIKIPGLPKADGGLGGALLGAATGGLVGGGAVLGLGALGAIAPFTAAAALGPVAIGGAILGGLAGLFHQGGAIRGGSNPLAAAALAVAGAPRFAEGGLVNRPGTFTRARLANVLAGDDVPAVLQAGEGVLSRLGMEAAGGEAGLKQLNRGVGGGGAPVINMAFRGGLENILPMLVDQVAVSAVSGNGSVRRAVQRTQRTPLMASFVRR